MTTNPIIAKLKGAAFKEIVRLDFHSEFFAIGFHHCSFGKNRRLTGQAGGHNVRSFPSIRRSCNVRRVFSLSFEQWNQLTKSLLSCFGSADDIEGFVE